MSKYDIDSIESLSFRDGVRTRIQMYLGSANNEGIYQAFKEILNNSTDEALQGYGKQIDISVNENDNSIKIRDYGRGVPFGINEAGKNVLVAVYTESHTGGKFNHDAYKNSSGLNGIGGSCVCLSSSEFVVRSVRDRESAFAKFEKGILVDYIEEDASIKGDEETGTSVYFIPDPEVFSDEEIGFSYDRICEEVKAISFLYPGITFNIQKIDDSVTEPIIKTYYAENGIIDFVKDEVKTPFNKHIIYEKVTDGTDEVEIAFQWGVDKEQPYTFVNGLRCPEGGSPIIGAKTALTRTMNNLSKFEFNNDKIRENLCYVVNCKVKNPSFANQTKSKINNANLRTLAANAFTTGLKRMSVQYADEFESIIELLKRVTRAEEAANRAREAIMTQERKENEYKKIKINNPDKFKDCEKHGKDSILIVAEGNSALGGLSTARDVNTDALYAIRGKLINALKHDLDEVLLNQEVSDIILALGCGINDKYDEKKLKYGKVAIAADADVDGYNIMCLVATMFYVLMPKFIEQGRLCWLRAPLYRLTKGKKNVYAYTEEELIELKKSHRTWEQSRFKGLGEMRPSDMEQSMLHKTERRLEALTIHDAEKAAESLIMLMGTNVEPRRKFLFDNVDFSKLTY